VGATHDQQRLEDELHEHADVFVPVLLLRSAKHVQHGSRLHRHIASDKQECKELLDIFESVVLLTRLRAMHDDAQGDNSEFNRTSAGSRLWGIYTCNSNNGITTLQPFKGAFEAANP